MIYGVVKACFLVVIMGLYACIVGCKDNKGNGELSYPTHLLLTHKRGYIYTATLEGGRIAEGEKQWKSRYTIRNTGTTLGKDSVYREVTVTSEDPGLTYLRYNYILDEYGYLTSVIDSRNSLTCFPEVNTNVRIPDSVKAGDKGDLGYFICESKQGKVRVNWEVQGEGDLGIFRLTLDWSGKYEKLIRESYYLNTRGQIVRNTSFWDYKDGRQWEFK